MTSDRATTLEKKKQILVRLYRIWKENPDLRLSQLIENVYPHDNKCMYHIEDFPFIEELEEHYEKLALDKGE